MFLLYYCIIQSTASALDMNKLQASNQATKNLDQRKNNMDDVDSILSYQGLKRKFDNCDNESRLPSKKRSCMIETSTLLMPSPSCDDESPNCNDYNHYENGSTNNREMTPFPETEYKVDCQLAEELLGCVTPIEGDSAAASNPIPLLTPPASPMPIKSDESVVEIYEWPSNLAVDNALTAAIQLRSLSPSSLAKLEDDGNNDDFVLFSSFHHHPTINTRKLRSVTKDFSSSPLIDNKGGFDFALDGHV